jgi:hypothetical protein
LLILLRNIKTTYYLYSCPDMRFSILSTLVVALAADSAVASSWFGKAVYNKWHETELERWLSDNNVPYPTPADRKDLENLVKQNWNDKVVTPYNSWDAKQLQSYLSVKGQQAKKGTEKNTNSLIAQVKNYWTETEEQASHAYSSVWNWIFDSWTESQLKAFLDRHGIPAPQPRTRDSLLKTARENYQSAANKIGETAAYPGDWLYQSWSESDLKAWLDERGYPAPQPSTRDKLIASVRRNSRLASLNLQAAASSASASAASAQETLTDAIFNAWSDSQIKEWLDKNNVKVPQGSRRNELVALARKHRARLTGDTVASTASSYYGAATSSAGNEYVKATDGVAYYLDWIKSQIGLGVDSASASAVSASSVAAKSASSASKAAASAGSSAYSSASKAASKSGQKAADAAAESASIAKNRAGEAAQKATDYAKEL